MSSEGFQSEAGQDEFYRIYCIFLNLSVKQQPHPSDSLRIPLIKLMQQVNSVFQCVSQGGTMYFHNFERIPAYAEWELWHASQSGYNARSKVTSGDIEKRLLLISKSYVDYIDNNNLELGITSFHIEVKAYQNWLMEKAFEFAELYE